LKKIGQHRNRTDVALHAHRIAKKPTKAEAPLHLSKKGVPAVHSRGLKMLLVQQPESLDSSARQHANQLIRLIRKLRWMGMEEEAERVQTDLAECGAKPTDSVLVAARETD
jgi:hypothetical protein